MACPLFVDLRNTYSGDEMERHGLLAEKEQTIGIAAASLPERRCLALGSNVGPLGPLAAASPIAVFLA